MLFSEKELNTKQLNDVEIFAFEKEEFEMWEVEDFLLFCKILELFYLNIDVLFISLSKNLLKRWTGEKKERILTVPDKKKGSFIGMNELLLFFFCDDFSCKSANQFLSNFGRASYLHNVVKYIMIISILKC